MSGVVLVALALGSTAAANKIHLNAADQKAAQAALLKLSEMPNASPWTGGPVAFSGAPLTCANFNPKSSDLVTTGQAQSTFKAQGATVTDTVQILATNKMVDLDLARTFTSQFLPCLASKYKQTGKVSSHVISAAKLPFAQLAPHTVGYRIIWTVTSNGKTGWGIDDLLLFADKRTEVAFATEVGFQTLAATKSSAAGVTRLEATLARGVVARALGRAA